MTGRSRQSPRQCPVSADAIASQLVKNGKYEGVNRRSSRLVLQEVSDLWRADPLHPANVSGSFSHREFAAALQHLKPGKAPGPDSICPELIIHAGAGLKSWLRGFLSSCLHHLKIPKYSLKRTYSYLNNVTVTGVDKNEHDRRLTALLDVAKGEGFIFNENKSVFAVTELNLLGYRVYQNTIKPDPNRLQSLINFPIPCTKKKN